MVRSGRSDWCQTWQMIIYKVEDDKVLYLDPIRLTCFRIGRLTGIPTQLCVSVINRLKLWGRGTDSNLPRLYLLYHQQWISHVSNGAARL